MLTNKFIYKYQSGFLLGHPTVHQLIEAIRQTRLASENYDTNCQVYDTSEAASLLKLRIIGNIMKSSNTV